MKDDNILLASIILYETCAQEVMLYTQKFRIEFSPEIYIY